MTTDRRDFLFGWLSSARPPAAADCEPLRIRIADLDVGIATQYAALREWIGVTFREYLAEGPVRAVLFVECAEETIPGLWDDEDAEFDVRADRVVQRDFAARRFEASGGNPTTIVARLNPGELGDALHNLLRWALPELLLEDSGFLLHAASVVRDGKGYVFFGQSGAGKSTSASLIAESDSQAIVLGDDAAIVRYCPVENAYWVYSAPLGSGLSRVAPAPRKVPLGGLYALQQSDAHLLSPLDRAGGVRALLASAMVERFDANPAARFDLAERFASSPGGIHRLHFSKDGGFWPRVLANSPPCTENSKYGR